MPNYGVYTATFTDIAVAAAQDLLSLQPATNRPIELISARVTQTSDDPLAEPEQLRVELRRGHTTAPSGGAAVTPVPLDSNQASSGATARRNDTTLASAGSPVVCEDLSFNIATGLWELYPEEARWRVQASVWLNLRLRGAPADSLTMSGTLKFRVL